MMNAEDQNPTGDSGTAPAEPFAQSDEAPPPGVRAMAIVRWLLVALMAVAAVAASAHYYGWFQGSGESSTTQYYCPMHPGVVQDHPGSCPICGMTLVPRPVQHETTPHPHEATEESAAAAVPGLVPVELTADRIQLTGMRTAPVARETLAPELRSVATLAASEKGLGTIQVRFAGWIERLFVEQTGQRVSKGQVLATIYGPEVLAVQQEYLNALRWTAPDPARSATADISGTFKQDARRRLELLGISDSEIDEIERSGQPLRAVPVRATVAGYVTQKNAVQGLYVQPGTPLFEVANLATIWALADVYEHEVARVRVGQQAELTLAAFPGETFPGKVTFIYPALDPATRTLRLRMEFPNRDLRLKPGMYGTATLALEGAEGLVVPREAIVDTGTLQYVFVAKPGGRFEPRRVTTGTRTQDKIQILEGLSEGEIVVTTANFLIDSESRLRATIEGVPDGSAAPRAAPASGGQPASETPPARKPPAAPRGGVCETQFDQARYPDKYQQCRACAVHRGMGTMEQDCIDAIAKPWK